MKLEILNKQELNPQVIIKSSAYSELKHMLSTDFAKTKEFMFVGEVTREGLTFVVEKFVLAPQEKNSAAYVETDDDRYPIWLAENYQPKDRKKVRLHGHSHVNMGVSPSGTDNQMINKMMNYVSDYYIQLIVNLKEEFTINIYDKTSNLIFFEVQPLIMLEDGTVASRILSNLQLNTNNVKILSETELLFNDNIILDLKTMAYSIEDKYVLLTTKGMTTLIDPKVVETYEAQIKQMVKPTVAQTYTSTYLSDYTSGFEDIDYYYGLGKYDKEAPKATAKKTKKKRCNTCALTVKEGCEAVGCGNYESK